MVLFGEVDISILIAKNQINIMPRIQKTIFHTQIDGMPNDQLSTLTGLPNNSFPMSKPGPKAKNTQAAMATCFVVSVHLACAPRIIHSQMSWECFVRIRKLWPAERWLSSATGIFGIVMCWLGE